MKALGPLPMRTGLVAGLALIVLTNAVTLGLVAWNRSGEPDAVLTLSERELDRPWNSAVHRGENSGLALTLRWRVAPANSATPVPDAAEVDAWMYGADAHWLDEAKLAELGVPPQRDARRYRGRSYPVLLVLELDGAAYRQALARARQHLAAETALRDANPAATEFAERVKRAGDRLHEQESEASRLFVIDAGLDAEALRARHPDRRRTAIVAGRIRPGWHDPRAKTPPHGYIERLDAATVNVPQALRAAVPRDAGSHRRAPESAASRFEAEIAFGRRLEPWLRQLRAVAPDSR
jgi:hypothetical protein